MITNSSSKIEIFIDQSTLNHPDLAKALSVFKVQLPKGVTVTRVIGNEIIFSNYNILSYNTYKSLKEYPDRSINCRYHILFDDEVQFNEAMKDLAPSKPYTWTRFYSENNPGYEVTSKGDRRFSPFFMNLNYAGTETSIEHVYQTFLDMELDNEEFHTNLMNIFESYLHDNQGLMYELAVIGKTNNLTDMFDPDGGQNEIYCNILNKFFNLK